MTLPGLPNGVETVVLFPALNWVSSGHEKVNIDHSFVFQVFCVTNYIVFVILGEKDNKN